MCVLYLHFIISFYFMSEIILYLNSEVGSLFPQIPFYGLQQRQLNYKDTKPLMSAFL
jgi:hypothetical protein